MMNVWYFTVPFFNLIVLGILIFLLWRAHKTNCMIGMKRKFLIVFTIIFIPVSAFFSWRFVDMAIYPHLVMDGSEFIWQGHHYVSDDSFDCDKVPQLSDLNKVAYEKIEGVSFPDALFLDVFFPHTLYAEKKDSSQQTIWELAIMDEEKYNRVD